MDRIIKFRGKSISVLGEIEKGQWVYGSLVIGPLSCAISTYDDKGCVFVDEESVGQFTGLTDRNGIEIYEGNIVEDESDQSRYIVEYDEEFARYILVWSSNEERFETFETLRSGNLKNIGNTYEHPHLSEGVK